MQLIPIFGPNREATDGPSEWVGPLSDGEYCAALQVVQIVSVRVRIVWANVSVGSDLCEVNRTDRYRVAIDTARYLLEAVAAAADAADAVAHCSRRAHRS